MRHIHVGRRIRAHRQRRHISQAELARQLEVSRSTVCEWEKGESEPSPSRLEAIARLLGITMAQFYNDKTTTDAEARE